VSRYPTEEGEKLAMASQFEPGDARRAAPMWDEPALKAVWRTSIVAPEGMLAIGNGPVTVEKLDSGKVKHVFAPTPAMSSYLLFFGLGEFDRIADTAEGVELGIVTRKGAVESGRYALNESKTMMAYYNDYFGVDYPMPKLDQIAVPGAGGFGAMENWGAILYFEPVLLLDPATATPNDRANVFGTVAHEIAHQWFGNIVTMNWWDDLWLNEGYASWMATKIEDDLHPDWKPWLKSAFSREGAMQQDGVISTHPIVTPVKNAQEATLSFDAITYLKGEAVIRMIEAFVGEEDFRDGVRAYMKKHAYGNAKTEDLWAALEAASEAPVVGIARDFTTQGGVPMIVVDGVACKDGKSVVTLSQSRFGADEASRNEARTWRVPTTAIVAGSTDVVRATISGAAKQTMTLNGCGAVKLNAGESGYYRTLYADSAFAPLLSVYEQMDAGDQIGLLNDSYALAATGYSKFPRFLELAQRTPANADPLIIDSIAGKFAALSNYYDGLPGKAKFDAFARGWVSQAFASVGWDARDGESENYKSMRTALIGTLYELGDPKILAEARKRYAAWERDPKSLSPDLLKTVVAIVASSADQKTFDKMLARARTSKSPVEQRIFYQALANVKDKAVAAKAIEAFLAPETNPQLAPRLFRGLSGRHPKMIWDYYRANNERIDAMIDPLEVLEFGPSIASQSSDPATIGELEAFAKEKLPEGSAQGVARATDRIKVRAATKARLGDIDAWLSAGS
jgi:aminopeptidase N